MTKREEIEKQLKLVFTPQTLSSRVESLVASEKMRYSEALTYLCEEHEIDPRDIAKLVKGPLKKKVEIEAMRNHVIPNTKGNTLDGL
jgi:hypothetical protein